MRKKRPVLEPAEIGILSVKSAFDRFEKLYRQGKSRGMKFTVKEHDMYKIRGLVEQIMDEHRYVPHGVPEIVSMLLSVLEYDFGIEPIPTWQAEEETRWIFGDKPIMLDC